MGRPTSRSWGARRSRSPQRQPDVPLWQPLAQRPARERGTVTYVVTPQEGEPFDVTVPVVCTVTYFRRSTRTAQGLSMGRPGIPLEAQILTVAAGDNIGEVIGREHGDLLSYYGLGRGFAIAVSLTWDDAGLEE